jgi:putative heme-binding domain-containing protein
VRAALVKFAASQGEPAEQRLIALEILGDQTGELTPALFDFVLSALSDETPALQRAVAASVLAQATLVGEQKLKIASMVNRLAPLELTRMLPVFETADEPVQRQVLVALAENDNVGAIRRDVLVTLVGKLPETLHAAGEALLVKVDALNAQRRERLEALYASLPAGDEQRGYALFHSKKAACIACHSVAYLGGEVGPDLTLIGKIRTDRDLLEAIVYPSASFVRSFEPLLVVTTDGQQFSGLIKQESASEIVLATGPTTIQRIPRDEIDEIRPSQTSLMPEGLDKILLPQELADLITYLKSRR